jgi:CheY-like chemotaxis protein
VSKRKKVLFVDDNEMDRLILSKALGSLDLDYQSCDSAESFLTQIKSYSPDLCLVDLNIKTNNDGSVLIQAIRNVLGNELPIIIISASENPEDIDINLANGANDFICKPIDKSLLSSKIANYLHNDTIASKALPLFRIGKEEESYVEITHEITILSLTQTGITFSSDIAINIGATIRIKNSYLYEIFVDCEFIYVDVVEIRQGVYVGNYHDLSEDQVHMIRRYIRDERG